jgi:hypothetical protein
LTRRTSRGRAWRVIGLAFLITGSNATTAAARCSAVPLLASSAGARGSRLVQSQKDVSIEVRVEGSAGTSVYIDAGRDKKLEVGDRVWFHPAGRSRVAARIRAVSRKSARAELDKAGEAIEERTLGRILVPKLRYELKPDQNSEAKPSPGGNTNDEVAVSQVTPAVVVPQRAPKPTLPRETDWSYGALEWDEERPLLAPPKIRESISDPWKLHGDLYFTAEEDQSDFGADARYQSWRTGLDMEFESPVTGGGTLELDVDFDERRVEFGDGEEERDSMLRVDEFSYRFGGVRSQPWRFQAGRFRQHEMTELGRLDGIEVGRRLGNGDQLSFSAGLQPERNDTLAESSDAQLAATYRWFIGQEERTSIALGAQRTWSDGAPDRELMIASVDASLGRRTTLYGRAWFDRYGADARAKSEGVELTQMQWTLMHRFEEGHQLSLSASRWRWPEIERYLNLGDELLQNGQTDRGRFSGRYKINDSLRITGRVHRWRDQDDRGGGHELGVELVDVLWPRGRLSLSAFETEGAYSVGEGYRVRADATLGWARLALAYNSAMYEPSSSIGDDERTQTDTLRASMEMELGADLDLSLFAQERNEEDGGARSLGFELRWGF